MVISIYNREFTMVTDLVRNNQAGADVSCWNSVLSLIIKNIFKLPGEINRYAVGKHFIKEIISTPSKTKCDEKATGRTVIDLAKVSITNVKKRWSESKNFFTTENSPSGKLGTIYTHI